MTSQSIYSNYVQRDAENEPQAQDAPKTRIHQAFRPNGNSPSVKHLTLDLLLCFYIDFEDQLFARIVY